MNKRHIQTARFTALTAAALFVGHSAWAASDTWSDVAANDLWSDNANWLLGAAPGTVGGTTSPDVATFTSTGVGPVTVDATRNIFGIDFAGNSTAYTLSGGPLVLTAGGTVQTSGGGSTHTDTISAPISLVGDASFATNSATVGRILVLSGAVSSAAVSGTTTLALTGTGTSNTNAVNAIISNGGGTNVVAVTKTGAGNWSLGGANTFTGGVTVQAGTLSISNGAGAGTGGITLQGGTLRNNTGTVNNAITVSGASAVVNITSQTTGNSLSGSVTGSSDQTINILNSGTQSVNFGVNNSKQLQNFLGTVSVATGQGLQFRGTITGTGNGSDNSLFVIDGSLATRNPGNIAVGALSGSGALFSGTSANGTTTFTIGARGTDTTFSGVISGGGTTPAAVVKTGASSLTLSGTNTYTGLTTVSEGTLATSGTGAISAGNVTLLGTNPVTLTLGSNVSFADSSVFTFASNSTINFNFTGSDSLTTITNGTLSLTAPGSYDVAALNSFFGGSNFVDAGTLGETLTLIPEPSSLAFMASGLCLFAVRLRRRTNFSKV